MNAYDAADLIIKPGLRKAGKIYPLKPNSAAGELTVARASKAYELNKDGHYAPVAINVPRFNYLLGKTCPAILREGEGSNLITKFLRFGNPSWVKSGATIHGDPTTLGAENVTNWDFSLGDVNWIKGIGWSIGGGVAHCDGAQPGITYLQGVISTPDVNKNYMLEIIVGGTTAGGVQVEYAGGVGYPLNGNYVGNGTWTITINPTTTSTQIFIRANATFIGNIESISIKEISGFASPAVDANGNVKMDAFKLVAYSANGYIKLATTKTITNGVPYSNAIFCKRITGTGTIYLIGINNTDIAKPITSEWTQLTDSSNSNSTSGQIGLKLATSGDAVMIYYADMEQSSVVTSPKSLDPADEGSVITRLADDIQATDLITNGLINADSGTIIIKTDDVVTIYRFTTDGEMETFIDGVSQGSVTQSPAETFDIPEGNSDYLYITKLVLTNTDIQSFV